LTAGFARGEGFSMGVRCVGLICLVMMVPAWRAGAAELKSVADRPADQAAALAQRGVEYAARKDFKDALSDLEKACELAPGKPEYFYALGHVQWQSGHPDLALQSFSKTLELKPDDVPALLARAQLRFKNPRLAEADLDAIDRIADSQDDDRLEVGLTYEAIGVLPAAIHQYDLWIASHYEAGARRALALDARCRAQAEANQNLDQALTDCNEALRQPGEDTGVLPSGTFIRPHMQDNPDILASRGFVRLRQGDFDRAIKDYDDAVAGRPKTAEYRFARGLAELRAGRQAKGQADIAAATAMDKGVAARFAAWGLKP
jgi:tetratricopeptide (TPR) repeat protein